MYTQEERQKNEFDYIALLTCVESLQSKVEIRADMFSVPEYKKYFEEISSMRKGQKTIVVDRLQDLGLGDIYYRALGYKDFYYGAELDTFRTYQEKIRDAYVQQNTRYMIERYLNGSINVGDLAKKLAQFSQEEVYEHKPFTTEMAMQALMAKVERIPMGRFDDFNQILNVQKHDLCTITAETSAGKTALALNLMSEMLPYMPCVYFNMEMSVEQISRRLVAIRSGLSVESLERYSELSDRGKAVAEKAMREMFDDDHLELVNGAQSLKKIKNIITTHDQEKTFCVFIDHMGFISDDTRRYENHTLMLDSIMRDIRAISEEFNCVVINISQMSRPRASDSNAASISRLKGSSEIEQSSVQVVAIQRRRIESLEGHGKVDQFSIDILKNRNGRTGTFDNVSFNKNNQRFEIGVEQFE